MLKRILTVAVLIIVFTCSTAQAKHPSETNDPSEILNELGVSDSVSIILKDMNSDEVLFEKNSHERLKTASTAKLLTCIVALENCKLDEVVTISRTASRKSGSTLGLRGNEELPLYDLLSGMMVTSGNDAAHAVAEHVAGGQKEFSVLMNETAQRIGMIDSNFTNSVGNSDKDHYSTAYDMSLLAEYAMQNEDLKQMASRITYVMPKTNLQEPREVISTNLLFYEDSEFYYEYATGLKTGTSRKAKGHFVASANKNGIDMVCVIMNDRSRGYMDRWRIAKAMFEYGYSKYTVLDIKELLEPDRDMKVELDYGLTCGIGDIEHSLLSLRKQDVDTINETGVQHVISTKDLELPVMEGDAVGSVTFFNESTGIEFYCGQLIALESIYKGKQLVLDYSESVMHKNDNVSIPSTSDKSDSPKSRYGLTQLVFLAVIVGIFIIAVKVIISKKEARK